MKLSEKMNRAIDDKKSTFFALPASTVSIWASEVAQLEADNAALKRENEAWRQAGEDAIKQLGTIVGLMSITALLTAEESE